MSGYFSGRQVRIECPLTDCESLFLLRDIKTTLHHANDMKNLANASFEAYIKTDEDLIHCPGDKASSHSPYTELGNSIQKMANSIQLNSIQDLN